MKNIYNKFEWKLSVDFLGYSKALTINQPLSIAHNAISQWWKQNLGRIWQQKKYNLNQIKKVKAKREECNWQYPFYQFSLFSPEEASHVF